MSLNLIPSLLTDLDLSKSERLISTVSIAMTAYSINVIITFKIVHFYVCGFKISLPFLSP